MKYLVFLVPFVLSGCFNTATVTEDAKNEVLVLCGDVSGGLQGRISGHKSGMRVIENGNVKGTVIFQDLEGNCYYAKNRPIYYESDY